MAYVRGTPERRASAATSRGLMDSDEPPAERVVRTRPHSALDKGSKSGGGGGVDKSRFDSVGVFLGLLVCFFRWCFGWMSCK